MNKDHIVHLSGALDRGSCQSLIDIFDSLNEYHEEGKIGVCDINYDAKKCTEIMMKFYDDFKIHPMPPITICEVTKVPVYTEVNFINCLVKSLMKYAQEYSFIDILPKTQVYPGFKIQKYNPNECYSQLHCESMGSCLERVLAWMIYLNDVTDGGETEFPTQGKKFSPGVGDVLIWPAYWTHPHRGIVSMTQTKYIATGWCCYINKNN